MLAYGLWRCDFFTKAKNYCTRIYGISNYTPTSQIIPRVKAIKNYPLPPLFSVLSE